MKQVILVVTKAGEYYELMSKHNTSKQHMNVEDAVKFLTLMRVKIMVLKAFDKLDKLFFWLTKDQDIEHGTHGYKEENFCTILLHIDYPSK